MKNIHILLLTTFVISCCNKDDDPQPVSELEKLPPATQTGANKIGCLLDSKAFLPGNYNNSKNCFYQFVDGEYYFVMTFNNKDTNFDLTSLIVASKKNQISQGGIYDLYEYIDGNYYGGYSFNAFNPTNTSSTHTGKLTITKLDTVNHIVSGTFWFDILDYQGNLHQIREGRFDMQYTN